MNVRMTTIKEVDLKKLMKGKGIKTIYQLAKVAGVDYTYLYKAAKGHIVMSENTWNKVKICL
jgi:hypothetical protein